MEWFAIGFGLFAGGVVVGAIAGAKWADKKIAEEVISPLAKPTDRVFRRNRDKVVWRKSPEHVRRQEDARARRAGRPRLTIVHIRGTARDRTENTGG